MQQASDSLSQASINVLQATTIAGDGVVATWVTTTDSKVLHFQGGSAEWPEIQATAPIRTGRFNGLLHVAVSSREVFVGTFYVFAAFLLLGLAANHFSRRLPLLCWTVRTTRQRTLAARQGAQIIFED